MSKVLLDANMIIYAAKDASIAPIFKGKTLMYASITPIEVLGYHQITANEANNIQWLIDAAYAIDLSRSVVTKAIELRQAHMLSLGDSITAATALVADLVLWTKNTRDFKNIYDLKYLDPLKS